MYPTRFIVKQSCACCGRDWLCVPGAAAVPRWGCCCLLSPSSPELTLGVLLGETELSWKVSLPLGSDVEEQIGFGGICFGWEQPEFCLAAEQCRITSAKPLSYSDSIREYS